MKKKLLSVLLVVALCIGVVPTFAACGGKSDVRVMLLANGNESRFYDSHFATVGTDMGITIDFEPQASADYYNKLSTYANARNLPDIIYIRQSDVRQFLNDGLIADISGELAAYKSTMDRIYSSASDMYKYDNNAKKWGEGGTYAVPKDLSVQQLGYNRTLIHKNRSAIYDEFGAARNDGDDGIPRNENGTVKMPWEMDWSNENYTWNQYLRMAKALNSVSGVYGCDLPSVEILTWSFGGSLISDDMQNLKIDEKPFKDAVAYQAKLIDEGAANTAAATYDKFVGDKNVCFYGLVNSFDIKNFDDAFNYDDDGNKLDTEGWGVMPWPYNPDTQEFNEWQGIITSAGYAVTSSCKNKEQAVKVIMSLYTDAVQNRLVQTEKLMLPLFADQEAAYVDHTNDEIYSPSSRGVYMDVISGRNGRTSDLYRCYETTWMDYIQTEYLDNIFNAEKGKAASQLKDDAGYTSFKNTVQSSYNNEKNK